MAMNGDVYSDGAHLFQNARRLPYKPTSRIAAVSAIYHETTSFPSFNIAARLGEWLLIYLEFEKCNSGISSSILDLARLGGPRPQ